MFCKCQSQKEAIAGLCDGRLDVIVTLPHRITREESFKNDCLERVDLWACLWGFFLIGLTEV